jgi:hypothetical protein
MRIVVASWRHGHHHGPARAHGDWIIWTIVQVSSDDAGASVIKGVQRIVATLIGGIIGLLIGIALADEPQFMFVAIGVVVAVCMFLSRTTSAPDGGLLVAFTMLLVVTSRLDAPDAQVDTALWRILMVLVGVVLGTGAQLVLWPRNPEHSLLDEVGQRLQRVEGLLARAATTTPIRPIRGAGRSRRGQWTRPPARSLANAEARYPSLRRRHTEQVAGLRPSASDNASGSRRAWRSRYPYRVDDGLRARLTAMAAACAHLRGALAARRPIGPDDVPYPFDGPTEVGPGLPTLVASMESTLARIAAATGFLSSPGGGPLRLLPRRSPLDAPTRAPILTPAFSLSNTADAKFALKCALAVGSASSFRSASTGRAC